jgi:hypothetical protein
MVRLHSVPLIQPGSFSALNTKGYSRKTVLLELVLHQLFGSEGVIHHKSYGLVPAFYFSIFARQVAGNVLFEKRAQINWSTSAVVLESP